MKIVTLVENTKPEDSSLEERFGLGFYIEIENKKILFDNGPDNAFESNAHKLNIDIADIDAFILSHAHYDHGAGLRDFFRLNSKAKVYLLEEAAGSYYSIAKGSLRYIGISHTLFSDYTDRFHFFNDSLTLFNNIHLLAVKSHSAIRPSMNNLLLKEVNGEYLPDDFKHELVMSVELDRKQVVFTGCAHNGLMNMIQTVNTVFPELPINTIVGGFHLMNTFTGGLGETPEVVVSLAYELKKLNIHNIYTGHCTGNDAFNLMHNILGRSLQKLHTGLEIIL